MYILLETEGLLNLSCYPRLTVVPYDSDFLICGFFSAVPPASLDAATIEWQTIRVASFDNALDAHYCLWHLFHSLKSGEVSWSLEDVTMPSVAWQITQKEMSQTKLNIRHWIETARLCFSGFYEWRIEYDVEVSKRYSIVDGDTDAVENRLRSALSSELSASIEIKWADVDVKGI